MFRDTFVRMTTGCQRTDGFDPTGDDSVRMYSSGEDDRMHRDDTIGDI